MIDKETLNKWNNAVQEEENTPKEIMYYTIEDLHNLEFEDATFTIFEDDGVSEITQGRFNLMSDESTEFFNGSNKWDLSHRIIVPWFDKDGRIVGWNSRYNGDADSAGVPKYMMNLGFNKGDNLFGIFQNKDKLIGAKHIWIFEAEKSVMKAYQNGIQNCIAVGTHWITEEQIELLKEINPNARIIIAFDEDVTNDWNIKQAQLIKDGGFNEVSYIKDTENKYLPQNSKLAPIDLGKDILDKLVKEYRHRI